MYQVVETHGVKRGTQGLVCIQYNIITLVSISMALIEAADMFYASRASQSISINTFRQSQAVQLSLATPYPSNLSSSN